MLHTTTAASDEIATNVSITSTMYVVAEGMLHEEPAKPRKRSQRHSPKDPSKGTHVSRPRQSPWPYMQGS
jgi:hypothetical protein